MGKLVLGPDEALKLIQIRYQDYAQAKSRWEACVAKLSIAHASHAGAVAGNYPEWMESEAKLNRLLDLLKELSLPPDGASGIDPGASRDSAGHL